MTDHRFYSLHGLKMVEHKPTDGVRIVDPPPPSRLARFLARAKRFFFRWLAW